MSTPARVRPPRIWLVALTPEAETATGAASLPVRPLPYRVGRESRSPRRVEQTVALEQRWPGATRTNELYLAERSAEAMNVSREHFQIEWDGQAVMIVDRGSTCGTLVEGRQIGGQGQRGSVAVKDGDVIIVGTAFSPFVFKLRFESD